MQATWRPSKRRGSMWPQLAGGFSMCGMGWAALVDICEKLRHQLQRHLCPCCQTKGSLRVRVDQAPLERDHISRILPASGRTCEILRYRGPLETPCRATLKNRLGPARPASTSASRKDRHYCVPRHALELCECPKLRVSQIWLPSPPQRTWATVLPTGGSALTYASVDQPCPRTRT